MARKTFLEHNGLSLCGDERDVMVPKEYYYDVVTWCDEYGVVAEDGFYLSSDETKLSAMLFNVNLWRIRDEQQRVMFILRWA